MRVIFFSHFSYRYSASGLYLPLILSDGNFALSGLFQSFFGDRLYSAEPDGYCGDEDNGQTSAWYVFSALGFYPVCPASDEYAIGTPYFKKAVIHLENGEKITVNAENNSQTTPYIKKLRINGKVSSPDFLKYDSIKDGAVIEFTMSESPQL